MVLVKLVRLEVVGVGLPEASLQAVMEAGTKYSDGIGFSYSFDVPGDYVKSLVTSITPVPPYIWEHLVWY